MKKVQLPIKDKQKLDGLGVAAVVLFGSRATSTATKMSDYDFGILVDQKGRHNRAKDYHKYYTAVYDILAERFGDLNGLDVVFLDRAPFELRHHVALYGRILMERRPGQVADFNAQTSILHADFEPYRLLFNQAVFDHI